METNKNIIETNKPDLVIPANMLEGLENYNTPEVTTRLKDMATAMVRQFKQKDADYGGSWQKDGIMSVHFNFKRKVDRVMAQFANGTMTSGKGENIADTLIDLATYSLMYAYYLENKNKNVKDFIDGFIEKFLNDGKKS